MGTPADTASQAKDRASMLGEARATRRATHRAELTELAERVARLETTAEHLQVTLSRIDTGLAKMEHKMDVLSGQVAQGLGGLRIGAVVGQAAAAIVGFVAAHLWPAGK
jgi:tetrahydromethanopterin S-methyltransferase subunit B